jgi:hypothetical protein
VGLSVDHMASRLFMITAMAPLTETTAQGIRRDRSGVLTDTLTSLVMAGECLQARAGLVECPRSLTSFRLVHRQWVLSCLPALVQGFESESVSEFLHVNTRMPNSGEPLPAARAALVVMRDALELLRGLRATLERGSGA